MDNVALLVKAYYETLYNMLETNRQLLIKTVEDVLTEELIAGGYEPFDKEKFSAYLEAAVAFIDERIELYNPFGMQYLYDRSGTESAFEMEMKLNWYDSGEEYEDLLEAARHIIKNMPDKENFHKGASKLIKEQGAFPDRSIISSYQAAPDLNKLPDYVVACAIEQIL
jgi:hypothetical protein